MVGESADNAWVRTFKIWMYCHIAHKKKSLWATSDFTSIDGVSVLLAGKKKGVKS